MTPAPLRSAAEALLAWIDDNQHTFAREKE